jgi:IclR family mhp operon transcriptional activator
MMPTYEPVTAILRALNVLETIAVEGASTIKSLHAATGLPKATLVRMVETLIHAGYVYGEGDAPSYCLTARALTLAGGFNRGRRLVTLLGPILAAVQKSTRWPSDIGILDQDAIVILETSRQPGMLSVNWQVGSRLSPVHTALGRAYLAFLPDEERRAALVTLRRMTGEPKDMGRFEARLAEIRLCGYALNDQEDRRGIRSIAAPIFEGAKAVASVNISVVAEAMSMAELEERHGAQIVDMAKRMSTALA